MIFTSIISICVNQVCHELLQDRSDEWTKSRAGLRKLCFSGNENGEFLVFEFAVLAVISFITNIIAICF